MIMSPCNMAVQLAEGKQLAFRGARDTRLECIEGRVWLTVEGQPCDFLLSKGERLRIGSNGLVLIQGLSSGSVQMVSMVPCSTCRESRFAWFSVLRLAHIVA